MHMRRPVVIRIDTSLEVVGRESSPLSDALQHFWADLVAVVEGEEKVRPACALEQPVRAGTAGVLPANAQASGQHAPGLGGAPVQAAVKLMLSRSSRSEAAI